KQQDVGHVGQRSRSGGSGIGEPVLDVADGVVTEVAGDAAAKARQPGPRRGAIATEELADERQRIALVALDDAASILDLDRVSAASDPDFRRQADERVTPEALAADDRFQQISKALVGELDV